MTHNSLGVGKSKEKCGKTKLGHMVRGKIVKDAAKLGKKKGQKDSAESKSISLLEDS